MIRASLTRLNLIRTSSAGVAVWLLALLTAWSALVVGAPVVVALLRATPSLDVTWSVSTSSAAMILDGGTWRSLANSLLIAFIAYGVGRFLFGAFTAPIRGWRAVAPFVALALYVVNPIIRGWTYQLFVDVLLVRHLGFAGASLETITDFVLPGLVLGVHYFPLLVALDLAQTRIPALLKLTPLESLIFVRLPHHFKQLPLEVSLFTLFCIFDVWVVQTVGGSRRNYWSTVLLQRGFLERNLPNAAMMVLIGFAAAVAVFAAARGLSHVTSATLRRIRPAHFVSLRQQMATLVFLLTRSISVALSIAVASWPLAFCLWYSWRHRSAVAEADLTLAARAAIDTLTLCFIVGTATFVAAAVLIPYLVQSGVRRRVPLLLLAFAPEICFLIASAILIRLRFITSGISLLSWSIVSFSVPIAVLLAVAHLPGRARRKAALLVPINMVKTVAFGFREFRGEYVGVFMLGVWLANEDILLSSMIAGPRWTTLTTFLFTNAKRGLAPSVVGFTTTISLVAFVLAAGALLVRGAVAHRRKSTCSVPLSGSV